MNNDTLQDEWQQCEETLERIAGYGTDQERNLRLWKIVAAVSCIAALVLALSVSWLIVFRPEIQAFVQVVQVDEGGKVALIGAPKNLMDYDVPDALWIDMLSEWVTRFRWRGVDRPQAAAAWEWLGLHTCGMARERLKREMEIDKPLDIPDNRTRQIKVKAVTVSDIPKAYNVFWEELQIDRMSGKSEPEYTGTFTVGRRNVDGADMRLRNPLGLCVSSFNWRDSL